MRLLAAIVIILVFCTACNSKVLAVPLPSTDLKEAVSLSITPTPKTEHSQGGIEPSDIERVTRAPALPMLTPLQTPEPIYKVTANSIYVRSTPSAIDNSNVIGTLKYEDTVYYLGQELGFSYIQRMDGVRAYCAAQYLVPVGEKLYAYVPPETSNGKKNELIDVTLYLPDAHYEQLFNTENNVVGKPLYGRTVFLLQRDTLQKLIKAYDIFKADGYTLKIYDAYRPVSAQKQLYDAVQNASWIANPYTSASNHNRGCAVDISLVDDATGVELAFPTPMHTFAKESARSSGSWTKEERGNVDYMTKVMEECGFKHIQSEWWHFADSNRFDYMVTDIDLSKIAMLPYDQLPECSR